MRKLTFCLSLLALLALAIMPVSAQDDTASVRVAHFSPDAPAVDVYVNGELTVENLVFSEVTPFLELDPDTYELAVAPAGSSVDDAVLGPLDLTVEAGDAFTVAAVGSADRGTLDVSVIEEDYSTIADGNARITVVHSVENESALDIYGSSILLIQALRYPSGGGDGAFTREVPVGRYNFEANIAETDTTIRVANGIEIEEGEYYLIVALGPQANSGELLVVTPEGYSVDEDEEMVAETEDATEEEEDTSEEVDTSEEEESTEEETETEETTVEMPSEGTAMLRVAHFSPDAPAVDIYIDGSVVVEGLEFPEVTPFLGLAGGTYEVAVAPAGTSIDDAVIGPLELTIEDDTNTTVAAIGSVDRGTIDATVFEEDFGPLGANTARITVVHTIEGESAIDAFGSGILLIQSLRYPGANSDGAFTREVPAGRYNFEANIAETDTTIRVANGIEIADGDQLMVVALGPQSNSGQLLIVPPEGYENPDDE